MKRTARLALVAVTAALSLAPAAPAAALGCVGVDNAGEDVVYACVEIDACVQSWGMVYDTPGPISAIGYDTGCLT